MTTRVVVAAFAVAATLAPLLAPLAPAWAGPEHAQRVALEVAVRRAQVRAALCQQTQSTPPRPGATGTLQAAPRLPSSPPVGTAGVVPLGDCSQSWWPLGR